MLTDRCTSCGVVLVDTGFTTFKCPSCSEGIIGRCQHCRDQSVNYTCPECGRTGP